MIHFIDSSAPTIAGDVLSEGYIFLNLVKLYRMLFQCREIKDLNRGRLFVCDIFHSRKIPHFKSLDRALEVIVQVLLTCVEGEELVEC